MKFKNLIDITTYFSNPQTCVDFVADMRWKGHVRCVKCGHDKVYTLKGANKRYKCAKCRKQFTVLTGTIFESSALPLQKWLVAMYIVSAHKKGVSSYQLGKDIGVTQKTAWFMLQRIRELNKQDNVEPMSGICEIDETYQGGKLSNLSKFKRQQAMIGPEGNKLSTKNVRKEAVLGIVRRADHKKPRGKNRHDQGTGGRIILTHIPDDKIDTLIPIVYSYVAKGATVYTDELHAYKYLIGMNHDSVSHSKDEYVRGKVHTNTIEGSFGLLKNGIRGIQHHVSPKHLQRYLNEFSFKYSTRELTDPARFDLLFQNIHGRLKYADLISDKKQDLF